MWRVFLAVGVCTVGGARLQAQSVPRIHMLRVEEWDILPVQTGKLQTIFSGQSELCVVWIFRLVCLHFTAWRQDGVKELQWRGLDGHRVHRSMRIFCTFFCKMTAPLTLAVIDQDCVELRKTGDHVSDGGSGLWCLEPALSAAWGRTVALSDDDKNEAGKGSVQEEI